MPALALVRGDGTDDNAVFVYLASLSPGSRRTMSHSLGQIARYCFGFEEEPQHFPWHELRATHTAAIRSWLAERYAPSTANKALAALRGVLRQCHALELIGDTDLRRALAVMRSVRGVRVPAGRALSEGERRAIFQSLDRSSELGARDWAIVAVLYGAGIRRSEAADLDLADLELHDHRLRVARGKGNKERIVYFCEGTRQALERYIALRGCHAGPVFHPTRGRVKTLQRDSRMSRETITFSMHRIARNAGIARFTPHDCRRTFVGDMLDAHVDLSTVQRLAGHASITTTARYDRRGERAAARAADVLCVPFD